MWFTHNSDTFKIVLLDIIVCELAVGLTQILKVVHIDQRLLNRFSGIVKYWSLPYESNPYLADAWGFQPYKVSIKSSQMAWQYSNSEHINFQKL